MKKRNILYGAIIAVCVIAIIIAVYYQFFDNTVIRPQQNVVIENIVEEDITDDPKGTLTEFNKLFTNEFYAQDNSTEGVEKWPGTEDKDIVYTAYDIVREEDEKYNINIKIPVINLTGTVVTKLNGITQNIFADKATSILKGPEKYTIYSVEYVAYLNDTILSLVIKSTLKEGNGAQRIIVQTYNYDIEEEKEVTLNEMLEQYGIKIRDVNKKIDQQVGEAAKQAKLISEATGQIMYNRDLSNSMYTTDNASNYFMGKDGQIYIVYAYGNNNVTSETDVIKVDM